MNIPFFNRFKKNSNIIMPFKDYVDTIGGVRKFMTSLKLHLDQENFKYHSVHENETILELEKNKNLKHIFFPVEYDKAALKEIKNRNGKIVVRLDGVFYYPRNSQSELERQENIIKDIYLNYADFIIFQSEYSKKQCFEKMGVKESSQYEIIINGADKKIFYPSKNPKFNKLGSEIIFTMVGSFRHIVMIEPVIKALDYLEKKYKFKINIIGPVKLEVLKDYLKRDYINYYDSKTSEEIAEILRNTNIYIHSQQNDNCPNTVIEALSAGLPVVGFDTGSMSELLFFSKDLLAYVSNETFQKLEDFKWQELAKKIELAIQNYEGFKKIALENFGLYSFSECGDSYIDVFNKVFIN